VMLRSSEMGFPLRAISPPLTFNKNTKQSDSSLSYHWKAMT